MKSKEWENLIKQEFGVSGTLAAKMYHEMLKPYITHETLYGERCPYYKLITFDYDEIGYHCCMAQRYMPRTLCGGMKTRCEK